MGAVIDMARDVNIDPNILKRNKIPPLIKDKEWIKLYGDNLTKEMKKLMEKLKELVKEEKDLHRQIIVKRKEKKGLVGKILKLSDEANNNNNEVALLKLEETKNKLLEINDEIDEIQFKMEVLPKEIENINLQLLKETVLISYNFIKEDKKRVDYLDEEIKKIRKKIGEMFEEKFEKEERVNNYYMYLHHTLGHEETDKLDKKFLK